MKRIGILGGTFDPPHYGHLLIAEEVRKELTLDEVWFMPSHIPPHKIRNDLSSSEDREKMVTLAIEDNQHFILSTIELERKGRSFTIDTMRQLTKDHPTASFYFIVGGDMVDQLDNWVEIEQLLTLVTFVGLRRPKYNSDSPYKKNIIEIDVPQLDISSSLIRERKRDGKNIKYLIPESVRKYICERGLYE
ncbi:nicotinate-nucleotide adenylyltransferase [Bacillus alkalicellulosilyticus]|uniref:nicotinate-nucleotide adenylyltransferase n=1 Tax=Alkalihalobacterium alkalicellulosilyticum TaxID=1912214 RepID=UPI000998C955|nr:nicotinate-nucleotide adenylyltransferase [Bacillus alkalicellulosilyticus]